MNTPAPHPNQWQRTTTRRLLLWFFRWHILRRFLLAIAILITLPALFYAVENWRGQQAWENCRRKLEMRGEQLTLPSLAPAPVPESQNLALAPLLKPLFDYTQVPDGPLQWNDTNSMNRLERIGTSRRSPQTEGEPDLGNLDKETFADLDACARFYRGNTNYPQANPGSSPVEVVRVALGQFDADLDELRAAATARPACRFPIDYGADLPAMILLPHLAKLKAMSSTLALRATTSLELGQSAAAMADWELAFRLSEAIREEPLLIDHLVRIVMLGHGLQVIREGLVRQTWTDNQLVGLQAKLDPVNLLSEYRQAIRGERACLVETLNWGRRQGWKFDPSFLGSFQEDGSLSQSDSLLRLIPGGWIHRNMVTVAQLHQDYSLAAVNAEARRVAPDISQAGQAAFEKLPTGPYTFLAKTFFPALANAAARTARMQTYVDAARVACALERHRLAQGRLPNSLDSLVPQWLERVPTDVIDGQPLRYRQNPEGGYALYSIGWNLKDDGGKAGRASSKQGASVKVQEGDWVWSLPR